VQISRNNASDHKSNVNLTNRYATRGIPHRRGYLFHGPPGTGKTSLSFALAGIFGLDIYCASLSENELKESDLAHLFTFLPDRCIVLLEDIDSAVIRREESSDSSDNDDHPELDPELELEPEAEDKFEADKKSIDTRKRTTIRDKFSRILRKRGTIEAQPEPEPQPQPQPQPTEPPKTVKTREKAEKGKTSSISLAGLLNIIDGASSHEVSSPYHTTTWAYTDKDSEPSPDHDHELPREP
jgi:chaperone BCS1